jgi:uncharacterized SAM-dependent methyltransferase
LQEPAYIPVDISKDQLQNSATLFHKRFSQLEILPVCADYLQPFDLPSSPSDSESQHHLFSRIDR